MQRLVSTRLMCASRAALAVLAALSLQFGAQFAHAQEAPAPDAVPTGGQVVAGSAGIVSTGTPAAPVVTVQQDSARAIVQWGSFNVGRDASVVFRQPDAQSVILNRVLDHNPTQIFGSLSANGQVFVMNPAGVWFGAGASVDVGALVATTHSIADADFMAGTYRFERNGATGKVVNEGRVEAKLGGYIALLAPEVRNDGVLLAQSGTIALAAGESVTMNVNPANSKVDLLVEPSRVDALVENRKIVKAPDGTVIVSAQAYNDLAAGVIKNSGEIVATGITRVGGKIVLGASTEVANSGKLDASSAVADGGSVRIDADTVKTSGEIRVGSTAASGKAGEAILTGNYIYIEGSANIDASGTAGGGKVLVGGDWQGQGDLRQAIKVAMDANASINANAQSVGDGGTVVLWSDIRRDSQTTVLGRLLARGGAIAGDGGDIETSGARLVVEGASVDASANNGRAGEWLLDPYDIEIRSGASGNISNSSNVITSTNTSSTVDVSTITNALNGGSSVTVRTGNGGSATGVITVNAAINKTGGGDATFTLQAADNVVVNQAISSTSNRLHLNLYADTDESGNNNGAGVIIINSNLTTNGGSLRFGEGKAMNIGGASTLVGGDVYVQGTNAVTFSTGGGSMTFNGEMLIGNSAGLTLNSSNGTINFNGTLNSANQYQRIDRTASPITWEAALTAAKSGNGDAAGDKYLATIASRLENAIASQAAGYQSTWLGGRRVVGYGTDNLWRWVSGPEGLRDSGRGLAFSSQAAGGGATSHEGGYINWSSGEPNNWNGSSAGALGSELESALQFTGSLGQWNDLPRASSTLSYYVQETNATPSSLTVNAGTGTVTFARDVGNQKALGNLNITAGSISVAGTVTTEATQTHNGNVAVNGSNVSLVTRGPAASGYDILFNNGITKSTAGDSNLTVRSHRDIYVNSSIQTSGAGTGKLNVLLEADREDTGSSVTADGAGFIQINGNISTNGGTLQFGNGATASVGGVTTTVGGDIYLAGSTAQTFSTGGGNVTVIGEVMLANTSGLTIDSGNGNVEFRGVLNSANSYAYVAKATGVRDTWGLARNQAQSGPGNVAGNTYLATITSRLENAIASRAANYNTAWLGGSRGGFSDSNASHDWY